MSWVAKLARATAESYANAPATEGLGGLNPSRMDAMHFYKRTRNPHTESAISKGLRLLGAPGSVPYRVIRDNSSRIGGVVSTPKIPGAQTLQDTPGTIDKHIPAHDLAHLTAAEWLMQVQDRHNENYLVSPKGVHSIDYGVGWDGYRSDSMEDLPDVRQSELYNKSKLEHAIPSHVVNRFLAAEPHIRRLMKGAMVKDNHTPEAIKLADRLFTKRIKLLKSLAAKFKDGPIPLNRLHSYGLHE